MTGIKETAEKMAQKLREEKERKEKVKAEFSQVSKELTDVFIGESYRPMIPPLREIAVKISNSKTLNDAQAVYDECLADDKYRDKLVEVAGAAEIYDAIFSMTHDIKQKYGVSMEEGYSALKSSVDPKYKALVILGKKFDDIFDEMAWSIKHYVWDLGADTGITPSEENA